MQKSRSRPRLTRRRPGVRPTAAQKAEYLDLIYRDFVAGLTVNRIAEKHGISTASVYRWQRQQNEIEHALNVEAVVHHLKINDTLELLCGKPQGSAVATREAFFQFITWIRWPSELEFHLAAMINCLASYLKQKYQLLDIQQLHHCESSILFKYLTLDVASRFSSSSAAFNPDFEIVTNATSRYDDRQFYAQVVNYLIHEHNHSTHCHYPTLQSLQALVEAGAFGRDWSMSPRTFEKYWRTRAASFPFLYVEQYHSPFDWSLNPKDADFSQSVDEVMELVEGLHAYFGRVKWVIHKLEQVLDPRATRRINFPKIPDHIEAIHVDNPALDARLEAKIVELF